MYNNYLEYINSITDITKSNFKSNHQYNNILEHVSYELGLEYLNLILYKYTNINIELIEKFITINDKYGEPKLYEYIISDKKKIYASPTSLRYIYHSLEILNYYKNKKEKNIVEIGCGYGGLFLACNFFSKELNIEIDNYFLIDLQEVCSLIDNYLSVHKDYIYINYYLKNANNYGNDINSNDLFLISNYCFTEIDNEARNNYIFSLFNKVNSGYIIWQTCFKLHISDVNIINKENIEYTEELPQTANKINKNYIVTF